MKALLPFVTFAAFLMFNPAFANDEHHVAEPGSATAVASPEVEYSEGLVKKVDPAQGKITIKHGPLKNLGMPGMTMVFKAGAGVKLDAVKPGDTVSFVAEDVGGTLTVTRIESAR